MKKLLYLSFVTMFSTAMFVNQISADVVVNDNFNRPDGSLVGTSPTPGPGSVWTSFSGTAGDLLITGGRAIVQHGVPSEDAKIEFASVNSGIISASFDITVSDDTVIAGGDYEYFTMFTDGGTANFFSRLDIVAANVVGAGNDFTFGISTNAGTAEATFATDFTYGTTYSGTLTYDFGTGLSSFTIGASTINSTTSVIATGLQAFALRQSDSSNNEAVAVDNLVVNASAIPEPGSLSILALVSLGLVCGRRKK